MTSRTEVTEIAVEASRLSQIPARHFEKDYYVTQVLRAIFRDENNRAIFKGGTSLSKAYQLIDRFSEDIDLLIDPLPDEDNPTSIDAILDRQVELSVREIGGRVVTTEMSREGGLARHTYLKPEYGSSRQSGISSEIRIEAGRRGGPMPTEVRRVSPMATSYMDLSGGDFEEFEVVVLHPARTLLEKLLAAKAIGENLQANTDAKVSGRAARHFYDIHALLAEDSPSFVYLSANTGAATELIRDCEEVSMRWFGGNDDPFEGSLADLAAFSDDSIQERLQPAYDNTCADLCYPGATVPPWADVVARVRANEALLRIA